MAHAKAPHLFQHWENVSTRIRAASDIRLYLDFDGTLVPIRPTPDEVKLSVRTGRILGKLSRCSSVHVALVSGRRNSVLRRHIRNPRIGLLGLYGWEKTNGIRLPATTRKALPRLRSLLKTVPLNFPGVRFEEKGVSFGIHFRGAPMTAIQPAQAWVRRVIKDIRSDFRLIQSTCTLEIVPRHVKGKGVALREIMKELKRPFLPIYLGDDLSDEPAFAALRRGITIRVGEPAPTKARYRLRDPAEVRKFLERLEKELR